MVHRYRLSNSEKIKDRKAIEINGNKFFKDRWLYSAAPLNIKGFEDIVVEESSNSKEDFNEIDKQRREEKQRKALEKGRQAAQIKQQKVEEKIEDLTEEQLESKSKAKIIEFCKRLGFKDNEIEGLKKSQLVDMILLDREVSEDV